jgi:hypothetical protein
MVYALGVVGRKAMMGLGLQMAIACGGAAADRQPEPTSQFEKVFIRSVDVPLVFVLVVDDRSEAEPLRRAIAEAFDRVATKQLELPRAGCEPSYDPGRWDPVDWSVVVVRPNAPEGVRYVTPADNPDLAWKTNFGTDREAHARFTAAVRSTLEPSTADSTARVRVLEAFADVQRLVQGLAPPLILESEQVLSLLDANSPTQTLVASAADDQSPLAPADYVIEKRELRVVADVIAPRRTPDDATTCVIGADETTERIGAWLEHGRYVNTLQAWPCPALAIFDHWSVACKPNCVDRMPEIDAAGSAACRVLVEILASEECPERLGWFETTLEPVAASKLGLDGVAMRVCEVRQLEGESLRSCQADFSCAACAPGWCWTTVPELAYSCEAGVPYAFRFPHGADFGPSGVWRIICDSK